MLHIILEFKKFSAALGLLQEPFGIFLGIFQDTLTYTNIDNNLHI